jgi:hypothetical protein
MFPELLPGEQEKVASSLLEAIHRTERHEVLR